MTSVDFLNLLYRLRSPANGANPLVPRFLRGERIPYPENFRVLSATASQPGETEFVLSWQDVEDYPDIDRYEIFVRNQLEANQYPVRIGAAPSSPFAYRIPADNALPVAFYVKTVLRSGHANDPTLGPTAVSATIAPPATPPTANAIIYRVTTKTANFSPDANHDVYLVNTSGGNITVTLPAASGTSYIYNFKKITTDSYAMILTRSGSDTIDGATSKEFRIPYTNIMAIPDSSGKWHIL